MTTTFDPTTQRTASTPPPSTVPAVKKQGNLFAPSAAAHLRKPLKASPVQPDLTPDNPPDPTITKFAGVPMSVTTFNANLHAATDAHVKAFGYKPSPAVALQAATTTPTPDFHKLFNVGAVDSSVAKAQAALAAHPPLTDAQFVKQLAKVARGDAYGPDGMSYSAFVHENDPRIQELQGDKRWSGRVHGIILGRSMRDGDAHKAKVDEAGLVDFGAIARPLEQVSQSLVHAPGGFVTMVTSVAKDLADLPTTSARGFSPGTATSKGNEPFSRTSAIAHGMVHQVHEDLLHPERNAGFLFLDFMGFASLGFSGVTRVAAGTRAIRAGEGVGAGLSKLAEKPPLQRQTVRVGDYTEEALLSQNPLVALAQKGILGYRQAAADKRLEAGPSATRSIVASQDAEGFIEKHLSFEKKVGRESDARLRSEHAAQMELANQLAHASGSAVAHYRVLGKLPGVAKTGLTRGDQKAIQAASWDVQGSILDKIAAEEGFHRTLIPLASELVPKAYRGAFVRAHRRQLGDLALARKAVETPSARFTKSLDLTQQVIAEQQRLRIEELGLSPETAEGRIAAAGAVISDPATVAERNALGGTIDRLEGLIKSQQTKGQGVDPKLVEGLTKAQDRLAALPDPIGEAKATGPVSDTSFYGITQPRGKVRRGPSMIRGRFGVTAGPYGVPPGRPLAELTHEFTGKALIAGNYRIDATNLAFEAYARTVRAVTVKAQHQKLWDAASPTKHHDFEVMIRDVNAISDRAREITARLDEGVITQADLDSLPDDIRKYTEELYPEHVTPEEMQHIRWIDGRLLGDVEGAPSRSSKTLARGANVVNAPFRFGALYLRPAYALNKLGNHAMLVFDQGFLNSGVNIARAMSAEKIYGEQNATMIRGLVGSGKAQSYVTSASGHLSQGVAAFWNRFADRDERVASFLYYADRLGYRTREEMHALLHDKAHSADLTEATRRSKKALVEFDNQLPFEKNVLRHIIFVQPWVRGSAVWSLRAVMEHPAKVDLLTQLGREEINNDPLLDKAAQWYKRVGYFPVGWTKNALGIDVPKVRNPTSINTFSTIDDFLNIGKGLTVGDKTASLSNLAGPAVQFGMHVVTGRDDFGNQYPGGAVQGALTDLFLGLPQLSSLKTKKQHSVVPFNILQRESLIAHENSMAKQAVFGPGWMGALGKWLAGGFAERPVNMSANEARYWNEQDPAARAKHDVELLNWALTEQGRYLKTPVPKEVRQAVNDQVAITAYWGKYRADNGGGKITDLEKSLLTVDYLASKRRIDGATAKRLHAQAENAAAGDLLPLFNQKITNKYLGGKQLRQWDSDVRNLWSFNRDTFNVKAARLFPHGLSPQRVYNTPQAQLDDYGRGFIKFSTHVRDLAQRISAGMATQADMRVYLDKNSQPVNGLPSYASVAWANSHQTPEQERTEIIRNAGRSWNSLTAVDKATLGKTTDPKVTEAWAAYDHNIKALTAQLPPGQRTLDAGQKLGIAKQADKYYGLNGKFTSDYLFAKAPPYQRLPYFKTIQDSPNRSQWEALFKSARNAQVAIDNGSYSSTTVTDAWNDYVNSLPAAIKQHAPGFWSELEPILKADPAFLRKIFKALPKKEG